MVSFMDEDSEVNAFTVGFVEAFRHPVALYPESVPTDVPAELADVCRVKFGQYNAGFYIGKVVIIMAVAAASYYGISTKIFGI